MFTNRLHGMPGSTEGMRGGRSLDWTRTYRRHRRRVGASARRQLLCEQLEARWLLAADFGEAPEPYPTLLADNGARHQAVGPTLGALTGTSVAAGEKAELQRRADDFVETLTFDQALVTAPSDDQLTFITQNAFLSEEIQFEPHVIHTDWFAWASELIHPSDIDGDGDIDVVASTRMSGGPVWWYENSGGEEPTFTVHLVDRTGATRSVFAADFDGDGDTDLLTGSSGDGSGELRWYENDGMETPSFTKHVIPAAGNEFYGITAGDIDDDGDIDIAAHSGFERRSDDYTSWFENLGDSPLSFLEHHLPTITDMSHAIRISDLDGDGDADITLTDNEPGKVVWYEQSGGDEITFTPHIVGDPKGGVNSHEISDIDGDGDLDILAAVSVTAFIWYENDGASAPTFSSYRARTVFPGDVDNDGDIDVVTAGLEIGGAGYFAWLENDGKVNPSFSQHIIATTIPPVGADWVSAADFDSDGDLDVLAQEGSTDLRTSITWYESNLDPGGFLSATADIEATPNPAIVGDPFTVLMDLDNSGADAFQATYQLYGVGFSGIGLLKSKGITVNSDFSVTNLPIYNLDSFPDSTPPTFGLLYVLYDNATQALIDTDFEFVEVGGSASAGAKAELQRRADDFAETLTFDQAVSSESTSITSDAGLSQVLAQNLVFNGDFELGNTGFETDYNLFTGSFNPQVYAITTNPQVFYPTHQSISDHTTGSGLLMFADGATSPNRRVWEQTVSVLPDTQYNFSAWLANSGSIVGPIPPGDRPVFNFSINGESIGTFETGTVAVWEEFTSTWNSGSATSARITIIDEYLVFAGNDFVLDDIFMAESSPGAFTATADIEATPNPATVGDPFTVLMDLDNSGGDAFQGTYKLYDVSFASVDLLRSRVISVYSDFSVANLPIYNLDSFPDSTPPVFGLLYVLYDNSTQALIDADFEFVEVGGSASAGERAQLERLADEFFNTLTFDDAVAASPTSIDAWLPPTISQHGGKQEPNSASEQPIDEELVDVAIVEVAAVWGRPQKVTKTPSSLNKQLVDRAYEEDPDLLDIGL